MSIIATLIVLFLFCSVVKVAWARFQILFVLVAFVALLYGSDRRRDRRSVASRYGS
jgi:hypothetical protein